MYHIRPWLTIGKYREAIDSELLHSEDITAVLHLVANVHHEDIPCLYLPVEDGVPLEPDLLQQGVSFILTQKAAGHKVLIACGAGISRAPTFAIAALKEAEDLHLFQALRLVRQVKPEAFPHIHLWKSLCRYYYQDTISGRDMIRALYLN